jgi:hypothetical protein
MSSGRRPDFIMANSCVAGAQGPGWRWVCAGQVSRAAKVPRHHSTGEPTGVGEGLGASFLLTIKMLDLKNGDVADGIVLLVVYDSRYGW